MIQTVSFACIKIQKSKLIDPNVESDEVDVRRVVDTFLDVGQTRDLRDVGVGIDSPKEFTIHDDRIGLVDFFENGGAKFEHLDAIGVKNSLKIEELFVIFQNGSSFCRFQFGSIANERKICAMN